MNDSGKFLLYTGKDGAVKVEVFFQGETVWLTQKAIAELFGVGVPAINKHLKNIFDTAELIEDSVVSIWETTAADGKAEVYRQRQDADYVSDFDREIKRLEGGQDNK
jgi:hypothetical protein